MTDYKCKPYVFFLLNFKLRSVNFVKHNTGTENWKYLNKETQAKDLRYINKTHSKGLGYVE